MVSGSRRLISLCESGNRSSVDEARSDGPEDETTVVEPDQGNGEESSVDLKLNTSADMDMDTQCFPILSPN